MKIGLAQLDIIWENKSENLKKCESLVEQASKQSVELVIFPEMTLTGFSMNVDNIGEANSSTVNAFRELTEKYSINIGFGYAKKREGFKKGSNVFSIISKDGTIISEYQKIHPFSFGDESDYYTGGSNLSGFSLNNINFSQFICYDLRFPEVFQAASNSAEAIIIIANWPEQRKDHWITLLKARAIENQCYIIAVNRCGRDNVNCYDGDSMIIAPDGQVIVQCNSVEQLAVGEIFKENVLRLRDQFKLKQDRQNPLYIRKYLDRMPDQNYLSRIMLNNKNIIVTGGCGLLGSEICDAIAQMGGNLIIADINQNAGEGLSEKIARTYKITAGYFPLDITSEDSVHNLVKFALKEFGTIDALINNAYPRNKSYGTNYENIKYESWRENIDLHLNGYHNVTQIVSKEMIRQRRGVIINMASIYGLVGPDFTIYEGTSMTMPAEYAAIKGGIINYTRYLASYLGKYNIRVNCVSPGGIFDNQNPVFVNNYNKKVPAGRMGTPSDIAGGVVFLLSDSAKYISGHNLIIDGGWTSI